MPEVSINYLAVVIAAIAGFLVGWGWYTVFGKVWQDALGKRKEDCNPTPLPDSEQHREAAKLAWQGAA
jgi:hypothetical protein